MGKYEFSITFDTSWNQRHIQAKKKKNYEKDQFFSKKIKILLLICSIEIANLSKIVLIIHVYRYWFLVYGCYLWQRRKVFPSKISYSHTGENNPYPLTLFGKPCLGNMWTEFCWKLISSWIICHKFYLHIKATKATEEAVFSFFWSFL